MCVCVCTFGAPLTIQVLSIYFRTHIVENWAATSMYHTDDDQNMV